jgi:hypothetical protein
MAQLSIGNGDRDRNGELAKKHGKILISALRKTCGTAFALGMPDNEKLIDVIHQLDRSSLSKLAKLARDEH